MNLGHFIIILILSAKFLPGLHNSGANQPFFIPAVLPQQKMTKSSNRIYINDGLYPLNWGSLGCIYTWVVIPKQVHTSWMPLPSKGEFWFPSLERRLALALNKLNLVESTL